MKGHKMINKMFILLTLSGLLTGCKVDTQKEIDKIMNDTSLTNKEKIDALNKLNNRVAVKTTTTKNTYTAEDIWHNMTVGGNQHHTTTETSYLYPEKELILSYVAKLQEDMPCASPVTFSYSGQTSVVKYGSTFAGYDGDVGMKWKTEPNVRFDIHVWKNKQIVLYDSYDSGNAGSSKDRGATFGLSDYLDGDTTFTFKFLITPYSGLKDFSYYKDTCYLFTKTITVNSGSYIADTTLSYTSKLHTIPNEFVISIAENNSMSN